MSTSGAAAGRPQRSSSTSRSSRRATMTIGPRVRSLLSGGSLSPQRAVRTRVLREKETNNGGSDCTGTRPKPVTKAAPAPAKGSSARTQHMQYAFGSKVVKPASTRTGMGMGAAAAGDTRGRTQTVASDAGGGALARPRVRDRPARNEAHEQGGALRVRASAGSKHPISVAAKREETDADHTLKTQLEEKDAIIADLKSKLERNASGATGGVAGDKNARAATTPATTVTKQDGGTHGSKHVELNAAVAQASSILRQEESLAEIDETLTRVETVTAAGLLRTAEVQTSVDELIRVLKARR